MSRGNRARRRKLDQEIVDGLDPGVTALVQLLYSAGYNTTDSGDGVSKFKNRERHTHYELDVPHVFVLIPRKDANQAVDDIHDLLKGRGVVFGEDMEDIAAAGPVPAVEGHIEPHTDMTLVVVWNVTDKALTL